MELWMIIVGISMSLGGLPQVYRMYQRKTSDDISILAYLILIHGLCWWFYYGIIIDSLCLIVTNVICLIIDIPILIMIVRYRSLNCMIVKYNIKGLK